MRWLTSGRLGVASVRSALSLVLVLVLALIGVGVGIAVEQSSQVASQEKLFSGRAHVVNALVGGLLETALSPQVTKGNTAQYGGRIDKAAFEALYRPKQGGLNTNAGAWAVVLSGRDQVLVSHGSVPLADARSLADQARKRRLVFGAIVNGFLPNAEAFPAVDGVRVLVSGSPVQVFSLLFGNEIGLLPNTYKSAVTVLIDPAGNVIAGQGPGVRIGKPAPDVGALSLRRTSGIAGGRYYARLPIVGGLAALVSADPAEISRVLSAGGQATPWILYGIVVLVVLGMTVSLLLTARLAGRLADKERELERSNTDLQAFAAAAAHDIRGPLRRIAGFIDLVVRDEPHLAKASGDYLSRVRRQALRLDVLVEDLMAYARAGDKSTRKIVSLQQVVDDSLKLLAEDIEATGAEVTVPKPLPDVHGDSAALQQMMRNLISNGIKFAQKGQRPRVEIRCQSLPTTWVIRVRDYGIGIGSEFREKVFLPFNRLHTFEEYEGTGLGLATVARIVERHGGTVSATAPLGPGTVIEITLPKGGK